MERRSKSEHPRPGAGARNNIAAIAELEEKYHRHDSAADRASRAIASWVGRVPFLVAHALACAAWIVANADVVPLARPFDPYPFCFLALLVALEATFLSAVVLMSQNRQGRQAEMRARLDLQVNMLAEQEATKMLQMLRAICGRLGMEGVTRDMELREMVETTCVASLAQELERSRAA
jgi:uncharacterized membrane protein